MSDFDKIEYWLEIAEYDIDTAKAMLETGRLLYVGFMCHQAIEKSFKAIYVKNFQQIPPYSHSLSGLLRKIGLESELDNIQLDLIDKLDPLNIEARYPTYKDEMFKSLSKEYCSSILNDTESMMLWVKSKL
ncbi:MAG: HEPN domain-containing protein [Bacteroidota bacterium]